MKIFLAVLGRMVRTVLFDPTIDVRGPCWTDEDCTWGEAVRWALAAFGLLFVGLVAATG
ncbi:MAG TPA: hypothetical protein VM223_04180 [Planctomycetota bacterium]|nr:hypothetical protein [Planctomycetota bacterium]